MTAVGYLGLGSNVGDRRAHLQAAIDALPAHGVVVRASSSVYDTEPVGEVLDQPEFLNACVRIETGLDPTALLDACKAVERDLGRVAGGVRHGPRPIDVDVLLLGDRTHALGAAVAARTTQVTSRRFVLVPLLELEPELVLPGGGGRAADALARARATAPTCGSPGRRCASAEPRPAAAHPPACAPGSAGTSAARARMAGRLAELRRQVVERAEQRDARRRSAGPRRSAPRRRARRRDPALDALEVALERDQVGAHGAVAGMVDVLRGAGGERAPVKRAERTRHRQPGALGVGHDGPGSRRSDAHTIRRASGCSTSSPHSSARSTRARAASSAREAAAGLGHARLERAHDRARAERRCVPSASTRAGTVAVPKRSRCTSRWATGISSTRR